MKKISLRFFAVLLVLGLAACYPPSDESAYIESQVPTSQEVPENVQTVEITKDIDVSDNTALVVFASGMVEKERDGVVSVLDIGDTVMRDDTIRVGGDGLVELQIGNSATMMLEENTVAVLERLLNTADSMKVQTQVLEGTVLAKVDGMREADRFSVRTRSTVAGVRGTQFVVESLPDGSGRVAVGTGKVMVLPTDENLEELWETVEERGDASAEEVLRLLEESAQAVEPGQEVKVTQEDQQELSRDIAVVAEMVRSEEPKAELVEQARESVGRVQQEVQERVQKEEVSIQEDEQLQRLSRVQRVPVSQVKQEELIPLVVQAEPADALIKFNGENAGRGRASKLFVKGAVVSVEIIRDGYESSTFSLTPSSGQNMQVSLVPVPMPEEPEVIEEEIEEVPEEDEIVEAAAEVFQPVVFHSAARGAAAVRRGVVIGDRYVLSDQSGTLYGVSISTGQVVWEFATNNTRNENSQPVAAGENVLFSGSAELVSLRASDGKLNNRVELGSDRAHLFGQNAAYSSAGVLLPADRGVQVLDPASLETKMVIEATGSSSMSPAVFGDKMVIVSASGELFIVDIASGSVSASIITDAVQPLGQAVVIVGNKGFFGDRRGNVFAVDLAAAQLIWQKSISGSGGVFQDAVVGAGRVFVLGGRTLYAFDANSGQESFTVNGATGAPALQGDRLLVPKGNKLLVMSAANGTLEKEIDLPAVSNTGVTVSPKGIFVGAADGSALQVRLE